MFKVYKRNVQCVFKKVDMYFNIGKGKKKGGEKNKKKPPKNKKPIKPYRKSTRKRKNQSQNRNRVSLKKPRSCTVVTS